MRMSKIPNQQKIWDKIAKSWNENKKEVFPDVKPFLKQLAKNKRGKILEIGCGNCRNLIFFKNLDCYGTDFSEKQIKYAKEFCKENGLKVRLKKADATNQPFKDESFDYVLSIAVVHHLKKKDREKSIKEIHRVLKNKGKALITVWNRYKEFKKSDRERYVPWDKTQEICLRYYYFFTPNELEKLFKKYFRILKRKISRNIIFLVEKN